MAGTELVHPFSVAPDEHEAGEREAGVAEARVAEASFRHARVLPDDMPAGPGSSAGAASAILGRRVANSRGAGQDPSADGRPRAGLVASVRALAALAEATPSVLVLGAGPAVTGAGHRPGTSQQHPRRTP
jgi:hypothetical protein